MRKIVMTAIAASLGVAAMSGSGIAQERDPAYQAARSQGLIGEKPDGYLGFVTSPSPAIKAMVEDINIKRKSFYINKAAENNATPQDFAFTTGCKAIARTSPGEKYQSPSGEWMTRTSAPPVRDARCP